ncbi:MAG: flagellar basal body protein FliL [Alcaligenaceae bacterium]|jgi:flagellar FliL protein|nr:flagellar basal body protein FliL [Alcaligenaceae bacterium]
MSKETNNSSPKSGSFFKTFIIIILCLGIGGAAMWYYMGKMMPVQPTQGQQVAQPVAAPHVPMVSSNPIFLELDPFTVTLNRNGFSRVLYVGFTLRFEDQASMERVTKYLPEARSRILIELSSLNPETIHDKATPDQIKEAVKRVLLPAFYPEAYTQHITDVLFTNFVVQ